MVTKCAVTYHMDDLAQAAEELAAGINQGEALGSHAVGILMCYSDMEVEPFVAELTKRLPFDIVGTTCIASMDGQEGFHEMTATLMVLSAEDCTFATSQSAPIDGLADVYPCIEGAYRQVREALGGEPKLLFAIPPYNLGIMLDEYTNALNAIAPGIPVVGGLPSNNGGGDLNATIFGDKVSGDQLVMVGIAGNIRPVFSVQNVTGSIVERKRKVTKAEGNTVYRVGDQTFVEYMEDVGIPAATLKTADTITFVANPLLLENVRLEDGEDYAFVRTLHAVDLDEGSGTAIGMIAIGATMSVCSLEKADIEQAAGTGMRDLTAKMEQVQAEGYAYSTILAVSCIGRYLDRKSVV